MSAGYLIYTAYIVIFCFAWWVSSFIMVRIARRIRIFEEENPPALHNLPKLSIIIAACNEADTIEPAVVTILKQDYPHLEIVLVDDRSTDGTGEIIDGIAGRDARVKAVHIEKLPDGWIGKVNALNIGTAKSTGDWLLFTDADVHFRQDTLRKALAMADADKSDHLALLPNPTSNSFWSEVVVSAFGAIFLHGTRAVDVGKPGSGAFAGTGAFNLVRRSAFEKTEGFSWLRMEPVDDVGLGLMMSLSGAKGTFAVAVRDISIVWYPSLKLMFRGVEKNFFGSAANYSLIKMILIIAFAWAYAIAPFAAIFYFRELPVFFLGVLTYIFMAAGAFFISRRFKQKFFPLFLAQIGLLIVSVMLLRSGIICMRKGGIDWRGTRYKTEDLLAGQRLKLDKFRLNKSDKKT
ncbi:MAG: glycosyltransferase [Desulfobacterales bacterium]|nr:glycosyltransferase [Desulfobacterales bacterium]